MVGKTRLGNSLHLVLTNSEQNGNVLSHFADQAGISLGVEFRFACGPIQTLQLIDEHCTFYLCTPDRQREGVGLALTCYGANNGETACPVISLISKH